jgi:phosphoribosylamine--glycine ligase
MNVLLLGSGGRENALAWKLAQSPQCGKLFIAPGNPGTARYGTNLSLQLLDFEQIARSCQSEQIDLLFIGPEEPLVRGITDYLRKIPSLEKMIICGPTASGARLEGSKAFAKGFMSRWDIPTARFGEFSADQEEVAIAFLDTFHPPYVIKADGLAAGKGVVILNTRHEAEQSIKDMFAGQFGEASQTIVLEEFLDGIEFSVFVLTDGSHYHVLPVAKDYKRIGNGDTGPNTGGMGAVSPVSFVDDALMGKVDQRIIEPTIRGLQNEGIPYQGFIFIGLIKVGNDPFVIEYNCRMGDPETEVVMPRLQTDLIELLKAMGEKRLDQVSLEISSQHAATIMMVSEGYPGDYPKGRIISGINDEDAQNEMVFHSGTRMQNNTLVTAGGRVLACTAMSDDLGDSLDKAYKLASTIAFEGAYYREDIGLDVL